VDPFGADTVVMRISLSTFQGTRWDRQWLERILEILDLDSDREIRYEITPRG
jgi:hypothetical protein